MQSYLDPKQPFINNGQHPLFLNEDMDEAYDALPYSDDQEAGSLFPEGDVPVVIFNGDDENEETDREKKVRDLSDGSYDD